MQPVKHGISPNYSVSKSHAITSMREINDMTVSQLKMIYIYLSKINPDNVNTKSVTISLKDYIYIMGKQHATRPKEFLELSKEMVRITTTIPLTDENNNITGFSTYPVFSKFSVYKNTKDRLWYVTIECHDDLLIHFFNLQSHYSSFKLWNLSSLNTVPHIRLYDLLQQYKGMSKIYDMDTLRAVTGTENKYARWDNFKSKVLDEAKEIFAEKTDIIFDYELISGNYRQVAGIKFNIKPNPNAEANRLAVYQEFSYNEEIEQSVKQITKPPILESSPLAKELYNICEGNFTEKQIQALEVILKEIVFPGYSKGIEGTEQTFLPGQYGYVECISYLKMFYKYTLEKNPKNKYKYLKKVLENQKDELNKTS